MKLKLLVSRAGPGGVENAGDIVEADKEAAARMIEAGHAVPVREKKVERAVDDPETEKAG